MTDAEGLATSISDTEPRFSFFKYAHKIDGSDQTPLIFIYTCPPGSKIKERMVYASSKAGVIRAAEDELGFEFAKKVSSPRGWPRGKGRERVIRMLIQLLHSSKHPVPMRLPGLQSRRSFIPNRIRNKGSPDPSGQGRGNDGWSKLDQKESIRIPQSYPS